MSAHELTAVWPAFFRNRAQVRAREEERAAERARRR